MRTVIARGRACNVVGHRIDQHEAATVCQVLRSVEHIPLSADVEFDGTVHLRPQRDLSTPEQVTAYRAFQAVTDARVLWLGARPAIAAACLLCDAQGVELTYELCPDCTKRCAVTPS